jgi:hypothetical protein
VKKKLTVALVLTTATVLGAVGVVATAGTAADPIPTVTREILAQTKVANAPGYTLYLVRTTAMPGTPLAKHYHPGTQNVYILSGTSTYTVYKGSARIFHGPAETATKPVKVITAGHTGTLQAGDWFAETPSLVHSAQVTSPGPFVVIQSGLLKTGQPLAIPVP